ncbi:hypothetical protein K435DRAFT_872582 [Dendrothele bispora CBS 962.96]|uniref:Uncharacterized protein n=1 Tax=Dendrothele bispora (strain CBS 962.96) TaxID=1314807 RepID=A0A4S8L186_DENBC|nr:hypothetical protein K435DRAFT_872582 [Dendrothele bispora CBS 962.96]
MSEEEGPAKSTSNKKRRLQGEGAQMLPLVPFSLAFVLVTDLGKGLTITASALQIQTAYLGVRSFSDRDLTKETHIHDGKGLYALLKGHQHPLGSELIGNIATAMRINFIEPSQKRPQPGKGEGSWTKPIDPADSRLHIGGTTVPPIFRSTNYSISYDIRLNKTLELQTISSPVMFFYSILAFRMGKPPGEKTYLLILADRVLIRTL